MLEETVLLHSCMMPPYSGLRDYQMKVSGKVSMGLCQSSSLNGLP